MPADNNFVATPELRFVLRHIPAPELGASIGRNAPILQQRWVVVGTSFGDALTDKNSEWRDVPLHIGQADADRQAKMDAKEAE